MNGAILSEQCTRANTSDVTSFAVCFYLMKNCSSKAQFRDEAHKPILTILSYTIYNSYKQNTLAGNENAFINHQYENKKPFHSSLHCTSTKVIKKFT